MKVAIIVHSPEISGGTYVIFQHALYLQSKGHDVCIVREQPTTDEMVAWHREAKNLTFVTYGDVQEGEFDVAIATFWPRSFDLCRLKSRAYLYFVQSIESRFYPESDFPSRYLAESTYLLDLPVITETTWIKEYLEANFGRCVEVARNGIRKDLYTPIGEVIEPRSIGKLRVLVEGPVEVGFKNVPRTIDLCVRSEADEVWLLTATPRVYTYPGVKRVFSRVPITDTPAIYRSCDVIVKLSYVEGMFGPPLEMFHCGGTAIVYEVSGHEEYLRHEENGIVIQSDDEQGVINAINRLKRDPAFLDSLKMNALRTAEAWPDWNQASEKFEEVLVNQIKQSTESARSLRAKSELLYRGYGRIINPPERAETDRLHQEIGNLRSELNLIKNSGSFRVCQKLRSHKVYQRLQAVCGMNGK